VVPQVRGQEVTSGLGTCICVSLGPVGSWVPGLLARRPRLNPVGLSFGRGRGLEVLARGALGSKILKSKELGHWSI
ncbi:unnamed protein product, partial [Prunus brigantina]